jgi:hypothetical protein
MKYTNWNLRLAALLAANPHIDPMTVRAGEV